MNTPPGFPDPAAPQPPTGGQPLPPQGPPPAGAYGPPPGSNPAPGFGTPGQVPPPGVPAAGGPPPNYGTPPNFGTPGQPSWMPQTPTPQQGSSKTAYILLGSAVVIALGLVAFLVTRVDDKTAKTKATVPSFSIPDITIPDFTIPEVTIPQITIPEITVPGVSTAPTVVVVPTQPQTPTTVAGTNLLTGDQLTSVIAQIATARGAAPLRILSANLYGEYVILQVQDPTKPANVDQYMWRNGSVGTPDPVTLTGDGDLESNLFSDSEVNWAAIPGLVAAALAQIPIEGANVSHINIERNLPFTADIKIRVFVDGTRGSGFLDADAQGNILEVNQG